MNSDPTMNSRQFNMLKSRIDEMERKYFGSPELRPLIARLLADADALETLRKQENREAAGSIRKQHDEMKQQFALLRERLIELETQFKILMSLPKGYGTFIRHTGFDEIENRGVTKQVPIVHIIDGRGFAGEVYMDDDSVKPQDLVRGQKLLLLDTSGVTHAVKALNEFEMLGMEAQITEILPEDHIGRRVMVSFGDIGIESTAYWLSGRIDGTSLDRGSRVLADPLSHLVVQVLPEKQSSRYVFDYERSTVTFADIGGLDSIVAEIRESLTWPLFYPEKYATMRLTPSRGFLLAGPPGCGKTLLAKAVINEMGRMIEERTGRKAENRFFNIKGPELLNMYVGNTEAAMRDIFARANKVASPLAPVMIFFDEADALFPARGSGISSDINNTIVPQFNAEMDGIAERGNVIVFLATNREELIDPAVKRPGRIDQIIRIPRPDANAAKEIFAKYLLPEWEMIHPKYNENVYTPVDKNGQPKEQRYHFKHDPVLVVDYFIRRVVERMFDPKITWNEFMEYDVRTGRGARDIVTRKLRYCDFISGADIEQIVKDAKQFAIKDSVLDPLAPMGIEMKHLYNAIEKHFDGLRGPQMLTETMRWLAIHGRLEDLVGDPRYIEHLRPASAEEY